MKYMKPEEGQIILQHINTGVCGSHTGAKLLISKMYRQGFFWPIAVSDTDFIARRCQGYQFFPPETWPVSSVADHTHYLAFSRWGLDLVGPFKKVKGGFTHIFIAVDKFPKWLRQLNSSKRSCKGLASPITLSSIMGLNLLRGSSRTFVQTRALKSTMP
jgi:hypothetical protein